MKELLLTLKHEPINPVRTSILGEVVYSSMWAEYMKPAADAEPDEAPICRVLANFDFDVGSRINQRYASILASMVCWLGTNGGRSVLQLAADFNLGHWPERYLLAWTLHNRRQPAVNSCARSIEFTLAPDADRNTGIASHHSAFKKWPELSAEDLEVVDHLMCWLASDRGQRFLFACEDEIEKRREVERIAQRALRLKKEEGAAS